MECFGPLLWRRKRFLLIPNHHNRSGLDSLYSLATYHGCCRLQGLNSLPITNHSPFPSSSTYNPGNCNFWLQVAIPSGFNFLDTARCRKKGYHYHKLQLLIAHQQWSAQQSMVVMLLNLKTLKLQMIFCSISMLTILLFLTPYVTFQILHNSIERKLIMLGRALSLNTAIEESKGVWNHISVKKVNDFLHKPNRGNLIPLCS